MSIIGFCVRRPIFTTMVTLIIVLIGFESWRRLTIDLLPEVDYPTISVAVTYENASPEEMETLVAEYVEEAVASVPGAKEISSTNAEGSTNVRVTFAWGTDLDAAANDIRDRLDRIVDELPRDADTPQVRKFDTSRSPVAVLGIGGAIDPTQLRQIVDDQVQYRIEQIPGVAESDVWGGFEREIQVRLDLDKIKALSIPLDAILAAIRNANINVPAGNVTRGNFEVTLRTPGEFTSLDELRELVVARRNDSPVRLAQIADVLDTNRRITRHIRVNGEPAVRLGIRKQSSANTVEVARAIAEEVEAINRDIPAISVTSVRYSANYIENAISNVSNSVMWGGLFAVIVLLAFLRSLRSTIIIGIAIPISIVATFGLMYLAGFSLNMMTLGGLALGVGMMVDNSIVVLENIFRVRREEGLDDDPVEAAVVGAGQVAAAVTASTLTTLVIFLPMLFVEGVSGQLFGQLGLVIVFSLSCSLVVSLTLVPAFSAQLLRGDSTNTLRATIMGALESGFQRIESGYSSLLGETLRARWLTLATIAAAFGGSIWAAQAIGVEFMPKADPGEVRVSMEMETGTRLELVDEQMRKIEQIVLAEVPEIVSWVSSVGASSYRPSESAKGDMTLNLSPRNERERSSEQIATDLRKSLKNIPGVEIRTRAGQGLRVLNLGNNEDDNVQVEVRGYNFEVLSALAREVETALGEIPGVSDARLSRDEGEPQELVHIDRERAADLGLSVEAVGRAIETAIAGSRAGNFREEGNEYRILVQLANAVDRSIDDILDLTIRNDEGVPVVLRNVVTTEPGLGPSLIERKNQERVVYVTGNVVGRDLGSVLADLQPRLAAIPRPLGYEVLLGGDYAEQRQAAVELLFSFLTAVLLVYMVMACLYESLTDPLIVMMSVPVAAVGVVVTLILTDTTLNSQSFIGCIMLAGIVVNNAVLIVDQATRLRPTMGSKAAVREAGRRRLRPILMTTMTTVLGLVPLSLGIGDGAEAQAPLARAVIGGLLSSTIITLVLIPIIYTLIHRTPPPDDAGGHTSGGEDDARDDAPAFGAGHVPAHAIRASPDR